MLSFYWYQLFNRNCMKRNLIQYVPRQRNRNIFESWEPKSSSITAPGKKPLNINGMLSSVKDLISEIGKWMHFNFSKMSGMYIWLRYAGRYPQHVGNVAYNQSKVLWKTSAIRCNQIQWKHSQLQRLKSFQGLNKVSQLPWCCYTISVCLLLLVIWSYISRSHVLRIRTHRWELWWQECWWKSTSHKATRDPTKNAAWDISKTGR